MPPQTQQAGLPTYDPANPVPYQAPQLPEITPPPTRPAQETQQPTTAPTGPQVARSGGGLATAAFGLDSILKGYMRGREQAQQVRAYKAKQLSDGLRYAYETAAQQYTALVQSGADPNSDEVKKADLAQRAAYQSLMQMQQNYINGQTGQGKKKSKGGGQSSGTGGQSGQSGQAGEDPMQLIASPDPQEKLRGIAMLQQKMFQKVGTPANAAVQPYLTPEYRKQLDLMRGQQTNAITQQGVDANKLALEKELSDLDKLTTLNPAQQKRQDELRSNPLLFPSATRTPHYGTFDIPGDSLTGKTDVWGNPIDPKKTYREVTRGTGEVGYEASTAKPTAGAKPGTEQAFIEQVAKEAGVDVHDLSAESQLKLRQSWASSNQVGKTVGQNYIYTDKETGQIVVVPLTRTTSGGHTGVPSVSGSGSRNSSTGTHSQPSSTQTHPSTSAASNTSSTPPTGSPAGARVIGHTLSQPQAKSQATTNDTYKKMKPLFGLLDAQEQYMNEVKADPSKATPRQDLSLVVAAVRAMNPGSVRLPQKELELETKAGSWGDQAARWYEKASTGLLPDDQRDDLFTIVKRETTKAGETIAADWQQYMSGQPLPSDLKKFAKAGASGSGSTGGASAPHAVDPILDSIFNKPKPQ